MTGWGQDGPYRDRPGFGTLAEAISGWAHLNGFPENPPTLPPMGLGDAVTSVLGAFAVMVALYHRDVGGGEGQMIDLAIYESQSIFERVANAIGRPELVADPRFADNRARIEHRDELDEIISSWIGARTQEEVLQTFEQHEAAIAPVYDIAQIFADEHFRARRAIVEVDDAELGPTQTCDVFPRLSRTPGRIRHLGPAPGGDTEQILVELGYSRDEIEKLRQAKVV